MWCANVWERQCVCVFKYCTFWQALPIFNLYLLSTEILARAMFWSQLTDMQKSAILAVLVLWRNTPTRSNNSHIHRNVSWIVTHTDYIIKQVMFVFGEGTSHPQKIWLLASPLSFFTAEIHSELTFGDWNRHLVFLGVLLGWLLSRHPMFLFCYYFSILGYYKSLIIMKGFRSSEGRWLCLSTFLLLVVSCGSS